MSHKSYSNHNEATFQKVLRPQMAPKGRVFDTWITSSSAEWQRVAVVQLTRYLCLEAQYRQDLDEHADSWAQDNTATLAVTEIMLTGDGVEQHALVGILTFRQFGKNPVLYHCYLHPFFRRKGLMKKAWQEVRKRYSQFEIEPPVSPAMERFLAKIDCSHILPST